MDEYDNKYLNRPPTRAQQEMFDAIIDGGGRASVSYREGFHITTRRGWGSNQRRTWEGLVARGLVRKTDDWDNIGRWWEITPREERESDG
jgi:hypothetical protein